METNKQELTKEISIIVGISIFIGFLLALNLDWPILSFEPYEFFIMTLLALLIVGVFVGAQKLAAYGLGCRTKTKLLGFKRYWFRRTILFSGKLSYSFPLWLVWPILLFLVTVGHLKWIAVLDVDIEPASTKRRKKFYAVTEDDVGKITLAGPLAVLALAIISKAIGLSTAAPNFTSFAIICTLFAFLSLIPFGLGFKLMVSSRLIWLFAFILSLFMLLLMPIASLTAIIFIALIFALIAVISYYMLYEK